MDETRRIPLFVDGGTERVPIEELGIWLEVKRDLSHAERKRIANASLTQYKGDGKFDVDMARFDIERAVAWIVDWSAEDARGKRVPFTRAAVEALSEPAFTLIDAALDTHVAAIEASREGKVTSNGHDSLPRRAAGTKRLTSPSAAG